MNSAVAPILFCSKCGSPTSANAQFCNNCGTPLPVASPIAVVPVHVGHYGGFWVRLVAFIIDALIVGAASAPFFFMLMSKGLFAALRNNGEEPDPATIIAIVGGAIGFQVATLLINWLYEAYMLSSEHQATFGKMALGLKVTDTNGQRISFARATGRHFAKILSGMLMMIGYIMAAFTDRKQALHDMLASTVVIKA